MTTLTEEQARELAQEILSGASADFALPGISARGMKLARYILSRPSSGVQPMADILTPELIKDAADAGERVGWESVLTNGAQIYHREIDLKKYETALRAVLPAIIDRLTNSRLPRGCSRFPGTGNNAGQSEGSAQAAPTQDAALSEEERKYVDVALNTQFNLDAPVRQEGGRWVAIARFLANKLTRLTAGTAPAPVNVEVGRAQLSYLLEVLAKEGVSNTGGDFMRGKMADAILALLQSKSPSPPTADSRELECLRAVRQLAVRFVNENDADLAVNYADPASAYVDLKAALFPNPAGAP